MTGHDLSGKTYCVVGGTSGMGLAIAEECIRRGADVVATGTSQRSVDLARDTLRHDEVTFSVLDIRDHGAVQAFADTFDRLDALVNCAGAGSSGEQMNPVVGEKMISVNLLGIYNVCIAMHAPLKSAGGCIVNLSSITAYFGSKDNPAYAAAKAGVTTLSKSLASLWRPDGIRVNTVSPGYIRTKMSAAKFDDSTGNQRWGTPEDVVGPTLFLCSQDAGFVTGADLLVDGGFMATATNFS